jgi:Sel1 repeat
MLEITNSSKAWVEFDRHADVTLIVSSVTNVIDIFLKCVAPYCLSKEELEKKHFLAYLVEAKSLNRCMIASIPFFGNLLVSDADFECERKALKKETKARNLPFPINEKKATQLFLEAAELGSPTAMFEVGQRLLIGTGIDRQPVLAIKYFRLAALLGHEEAYNTLRHLNHRTT